MILPPNSIHRRGNLNKSQWRRLRSLLPAQKPPVGRPSHDHRTIINGILWIVRTGAPWRDLPERYGAWATVSGRFYRWRKQGLWQQILQKLQQLADANGNAIAGSDYTATSGTLTFTPDQTTQSVTVQILSDQLVETNETLLLNLTNAVYATIDDAQAIGTILNDDAAPVLSVSAVPAQL